MPARAKVNPGDTVAYVDVTGAGGLGEVIETEGGDKLTLRAVNTAGSPVMYGVAKDDTGRSWNSWRPLDSDGDSVKAGNEGDGG